MAKKNDYIKKTEELVQPILDENGFELYDVEYVKEGSDYYLRVYMDKEEGITIDDCVLVSRRMNELLDELDYIDGQYIFEVSSPGLIRPIRKDKHLEQVIGENLEIKTYTECKEAGAKNFIATLKSFSKDEISVSYEGKEFSIKRDDISVIRTTMEDFE